MRKTCSQDSFHILAYSVTPMADSDVMTGVVRSFPNFPAALAEIVDARVFGGIHFRTACDDGQTTGTAVAEYVPAGVKIALDNQRPCAHWQASFRKVGNPHLTIVELPKSILYLATDLVISV